MRNIVIGYDGSESADRALARVPDLESPFVRVPGREVPDWLEHLLPDS